MRDLLHRCDSVCRHSHTFANSSYAWRIFAVIPSAIRSRLRCMGQLYAAGIFADLITVTVRFCDARAFSEPAARTAAMTIHLSPTVEIPANSKCRRTLCNGSRFNYETTSHHRWCGSGGGCFDLFCCTHPRQAGEDSTERESDSRFGENRHGSVQEQAAGDV